MTELTFNPSIDGQVVREVIGSAESWATIRAGAGTGVNKTASDFYPTVINTTTAEVDNTWEQLWRVILIFDTSSIPDDATILEATLSLRGLGKVDLISAAPSLAVYDAAPATDTDIIAADFNTIGIAAFSDIITYANFSITGFNDFTLNALGLANISKTGKSSFGLRDVVYDAGGAVPPQPGSGNRGCSMRTYTVDSSAARRPKLVVTYSLGLVVLTHENVFTTAEKSVGQGTITTFGATAVTQHGHVWSTSIDPTTADSKTELGAAPNLGSFWSRMTDLTPGTTYYVRAYATDSGETVYGANVTITTDGTIGRRYVWVEDRHVHYFDERGVERKVEGDAVSSDRDILAHLG